MMNETLTKSNELTSKIDELFQIVGRYKSSHDFKNLLTFVRRFHYLSPFNAMLVQIQRPGSRFVLNLNNWKKRYNITPKPHSTPLIILVPFGPVDYVFDISDMEGSNINSIPEEIIHPFNVSGHIDAFTFHRIIENLKFWGISVRYYKYGSQQSGEISLLNSDSEQIIRSESYKKNLHTPIFYQITLDSKASYEDQFATLIHELGHFFCGHLPPPKHFDWWNYRSLSKNVKEFEAETVSWLICERKGLVNPSQDYLSGYLDNNAQIPEVSIEKILTAVNDIEKLFHPIPPKQTLLGKKLDEVKKQLRKSSI